MAFPVVSDTKIGIIALRCISLDANYLQYAIVGAGERPRAGGVAPRATHFVVSPGADVSGRDVLFRDGYLEGKLHACGRVGQGAALLVVALLGFCR